MNLKTYQARSMAEALQRVKAELGRDAVILHTRSFKSGGVLGLCARNVVEITASRAHDVAELFPPASGPSTSGGPNAAAVGPKPPVASVAAVTAGARVAASTPVSPPERTGADAPAALVSLRDEMSAVRRGLDAVLRETRLSRAPALPAELVETYTQLLSQQVADELARELLADLAACASDASAVRDRLRQRLAAMVPIAGPLTFGVDGRPRVVALVGPTGMGKTTTLAKLAASAKLRDGRRVGLITIDQYRIGAVEQLRTYASILEIPLHAVSNDAEMKAALERLSNCELVLIDTAGRSPNDEPRLADLQALLATASPHEVHLVLASTHAESAALRAAGQFARLGADRIVFTKLDEAVGFGVMLNVLRQVGLKLSYVTHGQSVPSDIAVADAGAIADRLLSAAEGGAGR